MRLNAQNNQFIFQFPTDFVDEKLVGKFQRILDNNHMPYDNVLDFINSTIKEIVFPSISIDTPKQTFWKGKEIEWKESGNIFDKYQRELDITFRSVDSHINYFMLMEILMEFYQNNRKTYLPYFSLLVLDKTGDVIYTVLFKEILLKTLSELRMSYQQQDVSEKQFTITFRYNFIDVIWELREKHVDEPESIFDIPRDRGYRTLESDRPDSTFTQT
jgi:hypothetical protein